MGNNMTTDQYTHRNLQGFEGDTFMKEKFEEIIKRRKINLLIETGTYLGGTTKHFCNMVKNVATIEVNADNFNKAKEFLSGINNLTMFFGDSSKILGDILAQIKNEKVLIFLDAHWGNVCPLKEELAAIAQAGLKPVIVIHDFVVPNTSFGFDSYNGQPFTYEWIKEELWNIYEADYTYYYNTMAEGARRGIIYIEPK